tara:strand:- start:4606 stop:5088 length:483 start_codon:yes stop_codon:yes gene_type:complete
MPERHLTNKYNFAGPGTEYAARMKGSDFYEKKMKDEGKPVVGTKPYNVPINKLDACAKIHDKTYNNPNASGEQVQQADRVFQDCISKIKVSDGIQQTLLAKAAVKGFDAKLAVESTGVIRKGSLARGGDKQSVLGSKVSGAVGLGKKALGGVVKGIKKVT